MSVESQQANAERIVSEFKGKDKNSDFSHVMHEIIQLQNSDSAEFARTMKLVNDRLDMRDYGFPTDEELLRVNENGRLLTKSGNQINAREIVHLQLEGGRTNTTSTETWGQREFSTSTEGTAQYKIAKGDTLWSISKDVLTEQLGRKPSNSEINDIYRKIAEANGIQDANKLKLGQSLTIPQGTAERAAMPEVKGPSLAPNDEKLGPKNGEFNAMAAPGLPGADSSWLFDSTIERKGKYLGEGMSETTVTGQIDGNGFNNPKFEATQTTDRTGNVTSSSVKYDGEGLNLLLSQGKTEWPIDLYGVKQIDTALMTNGKYESTITLADGNRYRSVTNSSGEVVEFKLL